MCARATRVGHSVLLLVFSCCDVLLDVDAAVWCRGGGEDTIRAELLDEITAARKERQALENETRLLRQHASVLESQCRRVRILHGKVCLRCSSVPGCHLSAVGTLLPQCALAVVGDAALSTLSCELLCGSNLVCRLLRSHRDMLLIRSWTGHCERRRKVPRRPAERRRQSSLATVGRAI